MSTWIGNFVQIAVLMVAYYYIFVFFKGTRGAQVLVGLVLAVIALIALTRLFNLEALNWLLGRFSAFLAIAILIIFTPEIRRALAELGKQPAFVVAVDTRALVDAVAAAVQVLAEHRVGALIALEREIGTRAIQETGTRIDARLGAELLATIFFPHTPLHDGGVIVRDGRIAAAGCIFPLTTRTELLKTLGTRHRAAVGLSEETDAVVVVVSEETGVVSVAYRGRLSRGLDDVRLRRFLAAVLKRGRGRDSAWRRAQEQLDLTPKGIAKSERGDGEETHV